MNVDQDGLVDNKAEPQIMNCQQEDCQGENCPIHYEEVESYDHDKHLPILNVMEEEDIDQI